MVTRGGCTPDEGSLEEEESRGPEFMVSGNGEELMRGAGTRFVPRSCSGGVEVKEDWNPPPEDMRRGWAGATALIPPLA